jgi:hypothetical protein
VPGRTKLRVNAGVYLTFEDLRGRKSTLDEFRLLLRKFHREAVVHYVSLINNLLFGPGPTSKELHDGIVRRFMPPEITAIALKPRPAGEPLLFVYNQQQLLFIAKEALFECTEQGRRPPPQDREFGILFLMANDQLVTTLPAPSAQNQELLYQIASFLPVFELAGSHRWQYSILRPFLLLTLWRAMREARQTDFDPDELFLKATEIPVDLYFEFTFAVIAKGLEFDLDTLAQNPQSFGVDIAFFRNTKVEPSKTSRYLNDISLPSSEFARQSSNKWVNDFTCFRKTPAVRRDERVYAVDFRVMAGKCDSALFWKINDSLSDDNARSRFHEFWGKLFEQYLNCFFVQTLNKQIHRFYADPRYSNRSNDQVCDAIIVCGREAVFVEYKANAFKVESKYSGDWTVLEEEIEKKLIGTETNRKGIHQLSDAIQRVFHRGESVNGIDLSKIGKVFPMLITLDGLGGAAYLNTYLAKRFKQFRSRGASKVVITPRLFCPPNN